LFKRRKIIPIIMSKKLSILICALEKRKQLLENLVKCLKLQGNENVEILADIDNGERSVGTKRNNLLYNASGEYVCFIDDDDYISPFYTSNILKAIETGVDCIGLCGIIVQPRREPKLFIHSLKYKEWSEDDNAYYRCPNHLNPVKREIAIKVGFPDISYHEDMDYSVRLRPELKTETYIIDPLYFYYPTN